MAYAYNQWGGFEAPGERDVCDVREGYVSVKCVRTDYGVAIDLEHRVVLRDETEKLRADR